MERSEFLAKFGLGVAAACTGCSLIRCGSKNANPTPVTPQADSFTVNLNVSLLQIGDVLSHSGILIARFASGHNESSFGAVQSNCTHQDAPIGYNPNSGGNFLCALHGAEFNRNGQVVKGPATVNLKSYKIVVAASLLTVFTG